MKMQYRMQYIATAGVLLASAVCTAQTGSLRAGVAKVDITPPKEMFPLKSTQTFGSVHDPIYARALVLDNGKTKLAIVGVDILDWQQENGLLKDIADALKIPQENVMLNPSHDDNSMHVTGARPGAASGAQAQEAPEIAIMRKGMIEAAREANANLQPARIGYGAGKAYVNTNRDEKIGNAYHVGYNPDGPSDKSVPVMLVAKPTGEPIAIFTSYAVHSVVMFRTKTQDGQVQMTSDLAGWTQKYVEDHFPGAVAMWAMGAGGDQNPLFMANYNQDAPDVYDEGAAGWSILDVESRRLGEEIVRVTKAIQNTDSKAVLWGARSSVTCPGRKRATAAGGPGAPTAGGQGAQQAVGQGGSLTGAQAAPIQWVDGDPVTIPLQLLMVNDIAIAGIAGDAFSEIGLCVKKDSLFDRTMMVTLIPNLLGYVPSDNAYLMPSQMAANNAIKPGCAEQAIDTEFQTIMKSYMTVWKAAK